MQVGETRIRFRKVLVKYARRQWHSEQVLSESGCFLRFALDEWKLQGVKIISLFQAKNNFEKSYLTCLEYLLNRIINNISQSLQKLLLIMEYKKDLSSDLYWKI